MSKMIQIRDVPDRVHKVLTRRAALAGMSLSDFLKQQLDEQTSQWTWDEVGTYIDSRRPVTFTEDPVDIIRQARGPI
jgi:hypothetical protein